VNQIILSYNAGVPPLIYAGTSRSRSFPMLLMLLQNRVWVLDFRTSLIVWIVIGLIAGWIAGLISRGRGFGCIGNLILGLIGAVLGGWIFTKLGIFGGGTIYTLAAATVGAVVLVVIARLFSGSGND
jgi:uncharacterized membrane protein YeaQ/YmgE (transglycosylase-associated protein family)